MARPLTIFQRLLAMETNGEPLHDLIVEVCAVGDDLLALLIRYREETPLGHQPHMIAHRADAAIARAYYSNGDTPTNGKRAA